MEDVVSALELSLSLMMARHQKNLPEEVHVLEKSLVDQPSNNCATKTEAETAGFRINDDGSVDDTYIDETAYFKEQVTDQGCCEANFCARADCGPDTCVVS